MGEGRDALCLLATCKKSTDFFYFFFPKNQLERDGFSRETLRREHVGEEGDFRSCFPFSLPLSLALDVRDMGNSTWTAHA